MQRPEGAVGLAALARDWSQAVTGTVYVPASRTDLESYLLGQLQRITDAVSAEPFSPAVGYRIGAHLVTAHLSAPETLGRTVQLLTERLAEAAGVSEAPEGRRRLAAILGGLVAGHSRAVRNRTLDEQESIRKAALIARDQAESALRDTEARLLHQATHDPLTGLPNRALLAERLSEIFAAPVPDRRVGLCFLDLDRFQAVNDRLGHLVGDELLLVLARRLAERIGHLVARTGGDEFVVLIEDSTSTDDAVKVADAALVAIAEPVRLDGLELTVTACAGVVEDAVRATDLTELFRRADITLNWAKRAGRGRLALFDQDRDSRDVARYALAAALPAALARDEFFLHYQPLVGLNDGALYGVEALLRWRHPEHGVLAPDRFIDLAEESGLIVRLGAAVLEWACREAKRWYDASADAPYVSVNLAVRQIRDAGLLDTVTSTLERTGLPPHQLQLEITESAAMSADDESIGPLRALADLGVRVAIDDFGTGYANLSYLRSLPVRALKIAGTFVEGLRNPATDPDDEAILAHLVSLAHRLGLTVTAEGVETPYQLDRLRAIGCDSGQGWHLGLPGPAETVVPRLRD
jgi:diguanylate cyclase (GGDEF)-like protein